MILSLFGVYLFLTRRPAALKIASPFAGMNDGHDGFFYRRLEVEHISAASECLGHSFGAENPESWTLALGLKPDGFKSWMKYSYLPDQTKDGEVGSIVAFDSTSKVVGVVTVEDMISTVKESDVDRGAGYAALGAMMDSCKAVFWNYFRANIREETRKGVIGYIGFVGVSGEFRQRKIATNLVEHALDSLRVSGFEYAVVVCSNWKSTKTFQNKGFERLGGFTYADFEHPLGVTPFESLAPDECCVMIRRL